MATKLDVMDELAETPVCLAYEIDGAITTEMPATGREMAKAEPVYEVLPGWQSSTEGISDWEELPAAAVSDVPGRVKRRGCRLYFDRSGAHSDGAASWFAV